MLDVVSTGHADRLTALGWDDSLTSALADLDHAGAPGRVARVDRGGWVFVETAEGRGRARLHPSFRKAAPLQLPVVGDWVVLTDDPGGDLPLVTTLLPRTGLFVRGQEDGGVQALAANVDTALVVTSLSLPVNLRRIDRLVSLSRGGGADPVVVLSKRDACTLPEGVDGAVRAARRHLRGVPVVAVSAQTGQGMEQLEALCEPGRTLVLLGPSGVGKSTVANRLGSPDVLSTAEVRRDGKGRHTTTHRELLVLPNGALLIDTPGLRGIDVVDPDADTESFAEIAELAGACRFSDCTHEHEPGCAVKEALEDGTLAPARWDSYRRMRAPDERGHRS